MVQKYLSPQIVFLSDTHGFYDQVSVPDGIFLSMPETLERMVSSMSCKNSVGGWQASLISIRFSSLVIMIGASSVSPRQPERL